MKVYISADIEGVCGINSWDESKRQHSDYSRFRNQMEKEVLATCNGLLEGGAKEIWIRDAHESARNLIISNFPRQVRIISGWSGHPYTMMDKIEDGFDAAIMVGYHSGSGTTGNPLCHTYSSRFVEIYLNGRKANEFLINSNVAYKHSVPVVLVSGDGALCNDVTDFNQNILTVPTGRCFGTSTIAYHPEDVLEILFMKAKHSLNEEVRKSCLMKTPSEFKLEIEYKDAEFAFKNSFFPGMERIGDRKIMLKCSDYFEVVRAMAFIGNW
jgi:D-amino peptidase